MTGSKVEILRLLAFTKAHFTHPFIGLRIPFSFELVRDSMLRHEHQCRDLVEAMVKSPADYLAESLAKGLKHQWEPA